MTATFAHSSVRHREETTGTYQASKSGSASELSATERVFTPIPIPRSQLLARLLQGSLIQLRNVTPVPYPIPPDYDMNARCEYHSRTFGHTIDNCNVFKHKVQNLIDSKVITPDGMHKLKPPFQNEHPDGKSIVKSNKSRRSQVSSTMAVI